VAHRRQEVLLKKRLTDEREALSARLPTGQHDSAVTSRMRASSHDKHSSAHFEAPQTAARKQLTADVRVPAEHLSAAGPSPS
jgi:hypothetical protein